jgi:molecular chaperone DnaK (HSP70)
LIAAVAVLGIGRYSYKALQRMEEEWEDYQYQLRRYEKEQALAEEAAATIKTIAVDMGTVFTKIAATHPLEVIVTREGDRAFFNGVVYDKDEASVVSTGRAALERFYYTGTEVTLPSQMPTKGSEDRLRKVVDDVLTDPLKEALDRIASEEDENPRRMVITTPAVQLQDPATYEAAFASVRQRTRDRIKDSAAFLPEAVAAIWGAQARSILPNDDLTTLVVDVGGFATQLSIVQKDIVVYSSTIPWGGELMVGELVKVLKEEARTPLEDARSLSALQMQARSAVAELSTKTRVDVHVPYLFADPSNHHLDASLSRIRLEGAVREYVRDSLVAQIKDDDLLSSHMPTPTDLMSLWTSLFTQLLEQSQHLPSQVDHVLLVGGGAKSPQVAESVEQALSLLMGQDAARKLIRPESSLQAELTVLGAATMLPSYKYSATEGLYHVE